MLPMAPAKPIMARPTKLTKKTQDVIVKGTENGNYPEIVARAGGISKSTYDNWIARGQEGGASNARFVEFLGAVTRAEAVAETRLVAELYKAALNPTGKENRAGTEFLRRRHPDRWSTTDRIQGQVKHEHTHETKLDQEIDDLLAQMAAGGSSTAAGEAAR